MASPFAAPFDEPDLLDGVDVNAELPAPLHPIEAPSGSAAAAGAHMNGVGTDRLSALHDDLPHPDLRPSALPHPIEAPAAFAREARGKTRATTARPTVSSPPAATARSWRSGSAPMSPPSARSPPSSTSANSSVVAALRGDGVRTRPSRPAAGAGATFPEEDEEEEEEDEDEPLGVRRVCDVASPRTKRERAAELRRVGTGHSARASDDEEEEFEGERKAAGRPPRASDADFSAYSASNQFKSRISREKLSIDVFDSEGEEDVDAMNLVAEALDDGDEIDVEEVDVGEDESRPLPPTSTSASRLPSLARLARVYSEDEQGRRRWQSRKEGEVGNAAAAESGSKPPRRSILGGFRRLRDKIQEKRVERRTSSNPSGHAPANGRPGFLRQRHMSRSSHRRMPSDPGAISDSSYVNVGSNVSDSDTNPTPAPAPANAAITTTRPSASATSPSLSALSAQAQHRRNGSSDSRRFTLVRSESRSNLFSKSPGGGEAAAPASGAPARPALARKRSQSSSNLNALAREFLSSPEEEDGVPVPAATAVAGEEDASASPAVVPPLVAAKRSHRRLPSAFSSSGTFGSIYASVASEVAGFTSANASGSGPGGGAWIGRRRRRDTSARVRDGTPPSSEGGGDGSGSRDRSRSRSRSRTRRKRGKKAAVPVTPADAFAGLSATPLADPELAPAAAKGSSRRLPQFAKRWRQRRSSSADPFASKQAADALASDSVHLPAAAAANGEKDTERSRRIRRRNSFSRSSLKKRFGSSRKRTNKENGSGAASGADSGGEDDDFLSLQNGVLDAPDSRAPSPERTPSAFAASNGVAAKPASAAERLRALAKSATMPVTTALKGNGPELEARHSSKSLDIDASKMVELSTFAPEGSAPPAELEFPSLSLLSDDLRRAAATAGSSASHTRRRSSAASDGTERSFVGFSDDLCRMVKAKRRGGEDAEDESGGGEGVLSTLAKALTKMPEDGETVGMLTVVIHELSTKRVRHPFLRCTMEDRVKVVEMDDHRPLEDGPITLEYPITDITGDFHIELCGSHSVLKDERGIGQVVVPLTRLLESFEQTDLGMAECFQFFPMDRANRKGRFVNAQDNVRNMGMARAAEPLGTLQLQLELALTKPVYECYMDYAPRVVPPLKRRERSAGVESHADSFSLWRFKYNRQRLQYFLAAPRWISYAAYIISWEHPLLSLVALLLHSWTSLFSEVWTWPYLSLAMLLLIGRAIAESRDYSHIHLFADEKDLRLTTKNPLEKMQKVTRAMVQIQNLCGRAASAMEKTTNVFAWEDSRVSTIFVVVAFFVASFVSMVLCVFSLRHLWFLAGAVPLTVPPALHRVRQWRARRVIKRESKLAQRLTVEAFLQQEVKPAAHPLGRLALLQRDLKERTQHFRHFARVVSRRALIAARNIYHRIPDEPTIAHRHICLLAEDKNYRAYLRRSVDTTPDAEASDRRSERSHRRKRERLLAKLSKDERGRRMGPLGTLHARRRRHSMSVPVVSGSGAGSGDDAWEYAHEFDAIG